LLFSVVIVILTVCRTVKSDQLNSVVSSSSYRRPSTSGASQTPAIRGAAAAKSVVSGEASSRWPERWRSCTGGIFPRRWVTAASKLCVVWN